MNISRKLADRKAGAPQGIPRNIQSGLGALEALPLLVKTSDVGLNHLESSCSKPAENPEPCNYRLIREDEQCCAV